MVPYDYEYENENVTKKMSMLQKIRTVLIHNSHPGNIGSAARAMKNMGLETLYLVAPKRFPAKEAFYMASRADDIVERAIVVETVHEAIAGCTLVFCASSRSRALKWHEISPRLAAEKIIAEIQEKGEMEGKAEIQGQGEVAILYGCEQNGLSNEELELTNFQIVIPAVAEYASLNVAQAVQLISYEIYVAYLEEKEKTNLEANLSLDSTPATDTQRIIATQSITASPITKEADYATQDEMERFFKHLEQILLKIRFIDAKQPALTMSRLRRLFVAARLDKIELQILRGILTAIEKQV